MYFQSYTHAYIAKTTFVSASRLDIANMKQAVDENYCETFFGARTDQYSKSWVLCRRGATKDIPELEEKTFCVFIENLVSTIQKSLSEENPIDHHKNSSSQSGQ